ncbi:branched-chain amino acid ABC transporter permease [Roseomonas sp. HJA6]|uniref:Branched-chain amino acid ABC transporter permease n=1 Tax=Roseomonas alba TaxID=2846776 RepID=A0ABS7ABU2_9PROT|nr:branched-chain amino acid ABC transporter permease [Neoroseomonas alba]MBW6398780.1 branched-chain amino acid ABC transporter permease [Neoroseomonas alba]
MTRAVLAAALLAVVTAVLADDFLLRFLAEILLLGIAVMSLDLLIGFGGLVSLGHAALFGGAAYAAAIAARAWGGDVLLMLGAGIATGTLLAAAMGVVILRSGQLFLLILTLLTGQMVWEVAFHWRDVTGGADGLRGLPALSFGPWALPGAQPLFLLAVLLAILAWLVARSYVAAPIGRALVGTREQPIRMSALGYSLFAVRFRALLLAGAIAGAAGALYPFVNLYVGPQSVHWTQSAAMVIMLVIGGIGSLWGGFLGAAVYLGIQTYLSAWTDRWQLCVGLVFVLTVLLLPNGIAGGMRRWRGGAE